MLDSCNLDGGSINLSVHPDCFMLEERGSSMFADQDENEKLKQKEAEAKNLAEQVDPTPGMVGCLGCSTHHGRTENKHVTEEVCGDNNEIIGYFMVFHFHTSILPYFIWFCHSSMVF